MKPQTAKALGRKGQKDIVDMELSIFSGVLSPGDIVSRPMGSTGEDILMSPKAISYIPFAQEVKVGESIPVTIYKYYRQAESHMSSMSKLYDVKLMSVAHVQRKEDMRLPSSVKYPFLSIIKTEDLLNLVRELGELKNHASSR